MGKREWPNYDERGRKIMSPDVAAINRNWWGGYVVGGWLVAGFSWWDNHELVGYQSQMGTMAMLTIICLLIILRDLRRVERWRVEVDRRLDEIRNRRLG